MLLASAGLLVRSFVNVMRYDSGFHPSDTLTGTTLLFRPRSSASGRPRQSLTTSARPHPYLHRQFCFRDYRRCPAFNRLRSPPRCHSAKFTTPPSLLDRPPLHHLQQLGKPRPASALPRTTSAPSATRSFKGVASAAMTLQMPCWRLPLSTALLPSTTLPEMHSASGSIGSWDATSSHRSPSRAL